MLRLLRLMVARFRFFFVSGSKMASMGLPNSLTSLLEIRRQSELAHVLDSAAPAPAADAANASGKPIDNIIRLLPVYENPPVNPRRESVAPLPPSRGQFAVNREKSKTRNKARPR